MIASGMLPLLRNSSQVCVVSLLKLHTDVVIPEGTILEQYLATFPEARAQLISVDSVSTSNDVVHYLLSQKVASKDITLDSSNMETEGSSKDNLENPTWVQHKIVLHLEVTLDLSRPRTPQNVYDEPLKAK